MTQPLCGWLDSPPVGDVPNVCFPCGAVIKPDGDMLVYYGAADTSICIATTSLEELLTESFK